MSGANEMTLLPDHRPEVSLKQIPLGDLPSNDQLESEDPIPELVNAIESVGLLQPIVVGERDDAYHVHGGRRRIKAMRILANKWRKQMESEEGVEEPWNPFATISAYVVDDLHYEAHDVLTILLNSTARPNPLAELRAIETLFKKGYPMSQISKDTSLGESTIKKRLKLSRLEPELREAMELGKMSVSTAEKAARLPDTARDNLCTLLAEKKRITGQDVDDQRRVQVDSASSSSSLDIMDDMPGIDDIGFNDSESVKYLQERIEVLENQDHNKRLRWTRNDIDAVKDLLGNI